MNQVLTISPRNFSADWPEFLSKKEVTNSVITALSLVSLYKPIAQPVSLAFNGIRTITCFSQFVESLTTKQEETFYNFVELCFSTTSVAATYFNHPMAGVITLCHDLTNDIRTIVAFDKPISRPCLSIASNLLYLSFMLCGTSHIYTAYLGMSALKHAYMAYEEFEKDNQVGAGVNALLALVSTALFAEKIIEILDQPAPPPPNFNKELIKIFGKYGEEAQARNISVAHVVAEKGDMESMRLLYLTNLKNSPNLLSHTLQARQYEMANFLIDQRVPISEKEASAFILDIKDLDDEQLPKKLAMVARLFKYIDLEDENNEVFKNVLGLRPETPSQVSYQENVTIRLNQSEAILCLNSYKK